MDMISATKNMSRLKEIAVLLVRVINNSYSVNYLHNTFYNTEIKKLFKFILLKNKNFPQAN